jgi:glycosyltransferase involved in cell wall biosynthesis
MLSMGVPVVSTSLGALGTGCVHEEHALIADDADSFTNAVVALLQDASLRKKLTQAGQKLIRKHSWESFYPQILGAFEKAVSTYRRGNVDMGAARTLEAS